MRRRKAEEMTRRLTSLGFEVETDDYGNLIAHEEGDNPFMLSGHLDTVSPGNGIEPIVEGDRISSDGTTIGGGDDNAGLAIILETLTSMREDGTTSIPVEVVLTREEEPGLIGAHKLDFSKVRSRESIVFDREGPVNRITLASPTYIAYDFTITGRAAHAGIEPKTESRPSESPLRSSRGFRRGGSTRRPRSASGPSRAAPRATPCLRARPLPASSAL